MIDERTKFEMGVLWLDGVNTSLDPEAVSDRQFSWGINVDNARGVISTRPGFTQYFQTVNGKIQLLEHFRSSVGTDFLVVGVNGRLYVSLHPFTSFMDIGASLDPNADFFTATTVVRGTCRPPSGERGRRQKIATRRYLVVSDGGTNNPVYFDGATLQSSDPANYGIPKCSWMVYAKNRLWVWDTLNKRLSWSDIDDPLTFYTVGFLTGGTFNLDNECTGLAYTPDKGGNILAFERDKTWQFSTELPISHEVEWKKAPKFQRVLFPHIGCIAGKSFTYHYGDLWWWSNTGLMSVRRAMASTQDDELNPADLEMTRSRVKFDSGHDAIVGVSHDNYLVMGMPNGEMWVKNNSPASLLNANTSPAWVGVWTGLRPKAFTSFVSKNTGKRMTFVFSQDKDGNNRIWRMFNGTRQDNGGQITCSFEGKAHAFGGIFVDKSFSHFAARITNIWGDVNLNGYYRGTRGNWKQILEKTIRAATDTDENGNKVTQFRLVKSQEAGAETGCDSCGTESDQTDNIDGAFQVMLKWSGEMTLDSYQLSAVIEPLELQGRCEKDEQNPTQKAQCEDPSDFDYQPQYLPQTNHGFTLEATAQILDCSGLTIVPITWDGTSTTVDPDPTIDDLPGLIIITDDDPIRTYESTKTVTVSCIDGSGDAVTKTGTGFSTISQQDADNQAIEAATAAANAELSCTWTSTQTATARCAAGTSGEQTTASATYTSHISQEDADTIAMEQAQVAANALLNCTPVGSNTLILIGDYDRSYWQEDNLDPEVNTLDWRGHRSLKTVGSIGIVDETGRPNAGLSGVGANGSVRAIGPNWISGSFTQYNGIPRIGLAKVNNSGEIDTSIPDYFKAPDGYPVGMNTVTAHDEGQDGFIAVYGHFRSFNNGTDGPRMFTSGPTITRTYLLIDPTTHTIVNGDRMDNRDLGQIITLGNDHLHNRYFCNNVYMITRVSQTGIIDTSFLPYTLGTRPNGYVYAMAEDSTHGKLYFAGAFTTWAGYPTPCGIVRVDRETGMLDNSFQPSGFTWGGMSYARSCQICVYQYADTGGQRSNIYIPAKVDGISRVRKIFEYGGIDHTFEAYVTPARAIKVTPQGLLLVGDMNLSCTVPKGKLPAQMQSKVTGQDYTLGRKYGVMVDPNTGAPRLVFNSDDTFHHVYKDPYGHSCNPCDSILDLDYDNPGFYRGTLNGIR